MRQQLKVHMGLFKFFPFKLISNTAITMVPVHQQIKFRCTITKGICKSKSVTSQNRLTQFY